MKVAAKLIVILMMISFVAVCANAGDLNPTSGPTVGTMHTLTEIYDLVQDTNAKVTGAPVAKTGQTTFYATGDDGDFEKGVAIPSPRFTDNSDGTVTDNLTGLIWLKNANVAGSKTWADALIYCNALAAPAAELTDDSVAGDWRLPNIKELQSLIDFGQNYPALPSGHPFNNVQSGFYWSGTTYASSTVGAWYVDMYDGYVNYYNKTSTVFVWPVRGGND